MTDVLTRLAAADPLRGSAPPELDEIAAAIVATPREPVARRPRRRGRLVLAVGALLAVTATAPAAGGVDWDRILPGADRPSSQPGPLVDVPQMQREAEAVHAAIADPPGLTTPVADPNPVGDVGGGELGAGASQQLSLQMCTWQRALLTAHAAGDTATEQRAREVLSGDQWYVYDADGGAGVKAVNTDPARLADLQQSWDVNCPGGAYDRNTHPDAPPIGQ
jgi:hypothetical protein